MKTYRRGHGDRRSTILDDEPQVRVRLCDLDGHRADTATNVDDDGVLRERLPLQRC